MAVLINQKCGIYPTEEQKETLDRWLQYFRQTYNSLLLQKFVSIDKTKKIIIVTICKNNKLQIKRSTQDCSCCINRVKKSLSIRTHICTKCGTVLDRDYYATINILQKALEKFLVAN